MCRINAPHTGQTSLSRRFLIQSDGEKLTCVPQIMHFSNIILKPSRRRRFATFFEYRLFAKVIALLENFCHRCASEYSSIVRFANSTGPSAIAASTPSTRHIPSLPIVVVTTGRPYVILVIIFPLIPAPYLKGQTNTLAALK